jgi:hypothetical protein
VPEIDPERAAVGRERLDVEQGEAVRGEDPRRGREREVGEVLVVDRVVLGLGDQPEQVEETPA